MEEELGRTFNKDEDENEEDSLEEDNDIHHVSFDITVMNLISDLNFIDLNFIFN
jgi:hypothetical protein